MDLVPVYADAAPDGGVAISARQQQSFGVRTAVATEGTLDTGFTAVGAVGIDERGLVAVQARSPGYVERLLVRAQYDGVVGGPAAGRALRARVARGAGGAAGAQGEPASRAPPSSPRRRGSGCACSGCPRPKLRGSSATARRRPRVTVTAPQGGIVWEIGARDGMAVMPGTTLFKLAGIGSVWVTADVPEAQAALVRSGEPVEARAAALSRSRVQGVGQRAAAGGQRADAHRARADRARESRRRAEARHVRDGGKFGGAARKTAVLVPSEAVISTGKRNVVDRRCGRRPLPARRGRRRPRGGRHDRDSQRHRRGPACRRLGPVPRRFGSEPQGRAGAHLGDGRHGRAGRQRIRTRDMAMPRRRRRLRRRTGPKASCARSATKC